MVEMIDALYHATNSPLVMAFVTAVFAATATLLAFMAVIENQHTWSWMSIFLFVLASTAMFLSLVRTEPDQETLQIYQVYIRYAYILMGVMCIAFSAWSWLRLERKKSEMNNREKPR